MDVKNVCDLIRLFTFRMLFELTPWTTELPQFVAELHISGLVVVQLLAEVVDPSLVLPLPSCQTLIHLFCYKMRPDRSGCFINKGNVNHVQ